MGEMPEIAQVLPPSHAGDDCIIVKGLSFALHGSNVTYCFHIDPETGDVIADHYGGRVTEGPPGPGVISRGWSTQMHVRREFPDVGRGDFRLPAVRIKQSQGYSVSLFKYQSHTIQAGKPELPGLPSTFGGNDDVKTLIIHLNDEYSSVAADLSYSIFPKYDAIVRSVKITNNGTGEITVQKLASFSVDFPDKELEMLQLQGEWSRECTRTRRKVDYGLNGFGSTTGWSSHFNNPFLALVDDSTTECHGEAWGFSLVHSGSFSVEVEKSPQGLTRALVGTNPDQLSWPLKPGEAFTSPECVSVFSNQGIGSMSRKYHRLYRHHLMRSPWVPKTRPAVLNSWEGLYFDYDADRIYQLAQASAKLGMKIFVLDDGWFGDKYPRVNDHAGLGDWIANPKRFPDGLDSLAEKITQLKAANSEDKLKFGLWFEPEMVNPKSRLYEEHPDWVLHAGPYPRTEARQQLVLNAALPEVQDFMIKAVGDILESVPVSYVKWDNNRGVHETPNAYTAHANTLGLYRVYKELTTRFPDVLWEGCASGGGRFDPGILHYFPQIWTSDNTDPFDRVTIQFGTSLVYPPSAMTAHIAKAPNDITNRMTPISFAAHVAMMAGAFGFELDPEHLSEENAAQLPELIALSEKVNPIVIGGDMWRLNLPESSNYPAMLFISEDGNQAVLFAFQLRVKATYGYPIFRLQGLDPAAMYKVDGEEIYSGATLMNGGIQYQFAADYGSKVVFIEKQ